jgi:hypothetical protein
MSHGFPITSQRARIAHRCTWCGQDIERGTVYSRWYSINDDGVAATVKMHPKCLDAAREDGDECTPFENERPAPAAPTP